MRQSRVCMLNRSGKLAFASQGGLSRPGSPKLLKSEHTLTSIVSYPGRRHESLSRGDLVRGSIILPPMWLRFVWKSSCQIASFIVPRYVQVSRRGGGSRPSRLGGAPVQRLSRLGGAPVQRLSRLQGACVFLQNLLGWMLVSTCICLKSARK